MDTSRTARNPIHRLGLVAGLVLAGMVLAACGGGSSGGTASTATGTSAGAGASSATAAVVTSTTGTLGTYLTTGSGQTLYDFAADKGGMSSCYTSCATYWPPLLTTGAPTTSGGADAGKLGTTKRTDGTTQVTYGGHPLYTYVADSAAGETKGQGVNANGGLWWVVGVDGTPISSGAAGAPTRSAGSSSHYVPKY